MKISVVVCTRNRPAIIGQCIDSILINTYPDFELLLIDQSTNQETEQLMMKYIEKDKRIHYTHMNAIGRTKALNEGIKNSSGDIIAMTDDDCIVSKNWIESILNLFNNNPDTDILCGSVIDSKSLLGTVKARKLINDGKYSGRLSKISFTGDAANRSVRRIIFNKLKGFDELLGAGGIFQGSEDQDFAYRALKFGFRIQTASQIIVTHSSYRVTDFNSFLSVIRGYETGIGALYCKLIRCFDFISIIVFGIRFIGRLKQLLIFSLFVKTVPNQKSRLSLLIYLGISLFYWTFICGALRSLKFQIDKEHALFIPDKESPSLCD